MREMLRARMEALELFALVVVVEVEVVVELLDKRRRSQVDP